MRTLKTGLLTSAILLLAITPASAQRRPIEFGIDGMLAVHDVLGPDNLIEVMGPVGGGIFSFAPIQGFRVGFFLSDRLSFEPSLGFNRIEIEGEEDAVSKLGVSSTMQFHLTRNALAGPFVGIGGNYLWLDSGESASQFGTHALVGTRLSLAPNFYLRFAGGTGYFFENDDFEQRWTYFGTVGLSFTIGGTPQVAMNR